VGLPPISKSLILQGFISKKSRSLTAFRYTRVVHHKRHASWSISVIPSDSSQAACTCAQSPSGWAAMPSSIVLQLRSRWARQSLACPSTSRMPRLPIRLASLHSSTL
jgi:hypothetical protein